MKKTWIDWNQINKMTPEMAYILGLLWADGYVLMRSKNRGQIVLGNLKDDGVYFKTLFDKTGKWTTRLIKGVNRRDQMTFCCYHTEFIEWLYKHDYKAKSDVSADKILNTIPKNLHNYWFLGLIDGDGCIYINPNGKNYKITVASSINQDWSYLEKLAKELNITYKIKRRRTVRGNGSNFEITSRYGIIKLGDYLYQSGMGLPRKREKFNKIKQTLETEWTNKNAQKYISFVKSKKGFVLSEPKTKKYLGITKTLEEAKQLRKLKLGF